MPDPNPAIEALRKQGSALRQCLFDLEEKLVTALRAEATEAAAPEHPEDDPAPSFADEQLMDRLIQLVKIIAATTGRALELPDALEYAIGALKDLGTLAAYLCAPEELPDSTTIVRRAVRLHERWRREHDELTGCRQQARAYKDELERLMIGVHQGRRPVEISKAVDTTLRFIRDSRDQLLEAENQRDRWVDELTRLCEAYRRPEDLPLLKPGVFIDRAVALQRSCQRKALEQPQPAAARIVADFFEKVTAEQVGKLTEHLNSSAGPGIAQACATMLRALSKLAYPKQPAS